MGQNDSLIAVVDDDQAVREAIKGLLRSLQFTAEAFPSAEDFLSSPHLSRIALLIADVHMPGMSGIGLHCHLSAFYGNIPTILITAHPSDNVRNRALQAGVHCYLAKPFSGDDLLDCVRTALADALDSRDAP